MFEAGTAITFDGFAYDREDGWIDGDQISWQSDLDGNLGTGNTLALDSLTTGKHIISASVVDSQNQNAQVQVEIVVEPVAEPETTAVVETETETDLGNFYIIMVIVSIILLAGATTFLVIMKKKQQKTAVIIATILLGITVLCLLFSIFMTF